MTNVVNGIIHTKILFIKLMISKIVLYHINPYKTPTTQKNMELVALLSSGKGTWGQVSGLIKQGEWEKVIVIGPNFAKDFTIQGEAFEFVEIDTNKPLIQLKKEILSKLKDKIKGVEVALSIASGSGKEHMALQSALLSVPVGVRFTALTKEGVVFL